jgi:hypothetical protein
MIVKNDTKVPCAISGTYKTVDNLYGGNRWHNPNVRPLHYMFFTPLYGVRNTGCPQISTKKFPQISNKTFFFLDVIDPLKRFLHLKMLNSAPKLHKLMPEIPYVRFCVWK